MFPFTVFFILFFIVFIVMLGFIVSVFLRVFLRPHSRRATDGEAGTIKAEISAVPTKIRCSYCETLYNEKLNQCPHCGAPRKNATA